MLNDLKSLLSELDGKSDLKDSDQFRKTSDKSQAFFKTFVERLNYCQSVFADF